VGKRRHCNSRALYHFYGKGNEKHPLGIGFFVHYRKLSSGNRGDFVSDRISHGVLRVRCVISLFLMRLHQLRRTVTTQKTNLWGIKTGIRLFS
jgi:hypothetical protein